MIESIVQLYNNNDSYNIKGVTIQTPKNSDISKDLMEKVILSLENKQITKLEHVYGNGRLFSIMCSSLAWMQNQKNEKKIKIVYASNSLSALQYLEKQLKSTVYTIKMSYYNEKSYAFNQNEEELILIEYEKLLNTNLIDFENSILILDDFDYLQDKRILEEIKITTIKKVQNEVDQFINNQKVENELDQEQQYQGELNLVQMKWVQYTINKFYEMIEQRTENQNKNQDQIQIIEVIKNHFQGPNSNTRYFSTSSFGKYLEICKKIKEQLNLQYFTLWYKFIKSAIYCCQEIEKNKPNFSIIVDFPKRKDKNVKIIVKYYLQYLLDQFQQEKFHSILISSNSIFHNSSEIYQNLTDQIINKSEYFKTFFITRTFNPDIQYVNENLFSNLKSIVKCIPNGILVIFHSFKTVKSFKEYCVTQPDFVNEIETKKTLFWGLEKNRFSDYIQCSKKGAILFESYERVINRDFDFPGYLCKGLVIVQEKVINKNKHDQVQYSLQEKNYFQQRWLNRILGRSLLYEKDKGVLIILGEKKQWRQILNFMNDVDFQGDSIAQYEQEIQKQFQNNEQPQNDEILLEPYYRIKIFDSSRKKKEENSTQGSIQKKKQKTNKKQSKRSNTKLLQQSQQYFENQDGAVLNQLEQASNQENLYLQNNDNNANKETIQTQEKEKQLENQSKNKKDQRPTKNNQQQQQVEQRKIDYYLKKNNQTPNKYPESDDEDDSKI